MVNATTIVKEGQRKEQKNDDRNGGRNKLGRIQGIRTHSVSKRRDICLLSYPMTVNCRLQVDKESAEWENMTGQMDSTLPTRFTGKCMIRDHE